jgi:hypothetical protein
MAQGADGDAAGARAERGLARSYSRLASSRMNFLRIISPNDE